MSNIVPYRIQLDVKEIASQLSFSISLGDTGRRLIIQLVDDGKAFKLDRGTYAVFTAIKPDGNTIYNDCTIKDGLIIYDITEQSVSCVGITDCEIVLYDSTGYLITAPRFSMVVYDAIRSRVDIESATENLAIDEIGEQEALRRENELAREDNEATRIINEGVRGIGEAHRIASINVLRAYLGGYDLPTIDSPLDILAKIESRLADVSKNNFFLVNDDTIKSIAIIGNMITVGDTDAYGLTEFEPNKVYWHRGVRFVCLNLDIPEASVFDAIKESESSAHKWAIGSTNENDQQYKNSAKDWAYSLTDKANKVGGFPVLEEVEGEEYPKIPSIYLNQVDIKEYKKITDESQLQTIDAQKHDVAILVEPERIANESGELVETGELVITKSWLLYNVAEDGTREWIKYGLSYATNAGYATYANNAGDSSKINGQTVGVYTENEFNQANTFPNISFVVM